MARKGEHKKPEPERRLIAQRYQAYRENLLKRICVEHGLDRATVKRYWREFR